MQKTFNKVFAVILGLIFITLLYFLSAILTPFLIATLLAYLANPLVEKLTHWRMPRLLSVIIVFLGIIFVIVISVLLLVPLIQDQITRLIEVIPSIVTWSQDQVMPWINKNFGVNQVINVTTLKQSLTANWAKAGGVATWILTTIFYSGLAIIAFFVNLVLIPVVTFYLLRDWKIVLKNARSLLPRHIEPTVVKLAVQCDEILSAFFRGQLLVMLTLGVIYSIGLSMIGLQIGLMIGFIAGLVSIVPYLGFIIGVTSASVAAYAQFGTLSAVSLVWLVFAIGQSLESTLLTPKLVGGRIGLHPVAVIFAVLAGGSLFGFFGVLLALPTASVIMVLLRFINQRYQHSRLYQS